MSAWSRALYRRTSLPFRVAFNVAAWLRSRRRPEVLSRPGDGYLDRHTTYTISYQWMFGFHRVWDLVRHLDGSVNRAPLRVLSIGPRTEIEFYYLWLMFDFSWPNIEGVDLVSWSPKIRLGDMSVHLPFEDDRFDVVVACHSLEKSRDPATTRDEILRVARNGAWVLIGGDRVPAGTPLRVETPILSNFFENGAYGFISLYGLSLSQIEYMDACSPHGFELIFRVRK